MTCRTVTNVGFSILRGWYYMATKQMAYWLRLFVVRHGYYEFIYRQKFGRPPDYANPRTFSEKLAWMRLFDHNPLYTQLVDKIRMRDYVRDRIGEQVLIPCYGTWKRAADIQFDSLPEKFVLKCNHESGFVIVCHDRSQLDTNFVRAQLETRLRMNYYYRFLEWPYRDVPPRILAEKLLYDEHGGEPIDYKFHCFDGVPRFVFAVKDRHSKPIRAYYSPEWELLPFTCPRYGTPAEILPRPALLERMLDIAMALSNGLHYCRVDLYAFQKQVYVGEITIISSAGLLKFAPEEYDRYWGDCIKLPSRND